MSYSRRRNSRSGDFDDSEGGFLGSYVPSGSHRSTRTRPGGGNGGRHSRHRRDSGTLSSTPTKSGSRVQPVAVKRPLEWKKEFSPFVTHTPHRLSTAAAASSFRDSLNLSGGRGGLGRLGGSDSEEEEDDFTESLLADFGFDATDAADLLGLAEQGDQLTSGLFDEDDAPVDGGGDDSPFSVSTVATGTTTATTTAAADIASHPAYASLKSNYDALLLLHSKQQQKTQSSSPSISILKSQLETLRREKADLGRVVERLRHGSSGTNGGGGGNGGGRSSSIDVALGAEAAAQLRRRVGLLMREKAELSEKVARLLRTTTEAAAAAAAQKDRNLKMRVLEEENEENERNESSVLRLRVDELEQERVQLRSTLARLKKAHESQIRTVAGKLRDAMKEKILAVNSECMSRLKAAAAKRKELERKLKEAREREGRERMSAGEEADRVRTEWEEAKSGWEAEKQRLQGVLETERDRLATEHATALSKEKNLRQSVQREVERLRSESESSTDALSQLRTDFQTQGAELEKKKSLFLQYKSASEDELSSLRQILSKKESEASQLEQRLSSRTSELSNLRSQFVKYKAHVEDVVQKLKGAVGQRDGQIALLKKRLDESVGVLRRGLQSVSLKLHRVEFEHFRREARSNIADLGELFRSQAKKIAVPLLQRMGLLEKKYDAETRLRRRIFNELQDLKGQIRVFVRVRPLLPMDRSRAPPCVDCIPEMPLLYVRNVRNSDVKFEFDMVFDPGTTQQNVFDEVCPLSTSVLDGYNVCIFAYGQTGSGKTFTMEGHEEMRDEELRGVNFRAVTELFSVIAQRTEEYDYRVEVSIIEIYKNRVYDLLAGDRRIERQLRLAGSNVEVLDVAHRDVVCLSDVVRQLRRAKRIRATASTKVNLHSSRSHCVVSLLAVGRNRLNGVECFGKLHLIDLAGSERLKKTQLEDPDRVAEAVSINKSLTCLGMVMQALAKKSAHVPFRNSALTSYLKDSLGGQSKVLMFCCLNPAEESREESLNSLKFARRIRKIELGKAERNIRHTMN